MEIYLFSFKYTVLAEIGATLKIHKLLPPMYANLIYQITKLNIRLTKSRPIVTNPYKIHNNF